MVSYLSERKGKESFWAYPMFGYMVAMFANVFIPHIPASIMFRSCTPGVVTAVLINLSVMAFSRSGAVREGWVPERKAVRSMWQCPSPSVTGFRFCSLSARCLWERQP